MNRFLEDFALSFVDIDRPKEITFEQEKILAEINKYFSENIKDVLHNYDRNIPRRDEYNLIIEGLPEVGVMQNFMKVDPGVSNQQEISVSASQKNNNSQQSSDATQRIEKRSKLPIITASAGLLLGLGIAYFAGAAALTIVGAVTVFVTAAVVGTLVGYSVGKFYEKVSSKLSDASTEHPDTNSHYIG
ncbi:MAG: hypothetical protein LBU02_01420 [Rickettsiales bacterium]|jgi:hypothetical protein|nr:hypothetical protein [Rickettsiales bacterium]